MTEFVDRYRGSGLTSSQMREAPKGAIFIWPNQQTINYAKRLANYLNRTDLDIVSASTLDNGASYYFGRNISGIILDHSIMLNLDRLKEYEIALKCIK